MMSQALCRKQPSACVTGRDHSRGHQEDGHAEQANRLKHVSFYSHNAFTPGTGYSLLVIGQNQGPTIQGSLIDDQ
jgi:hypothetical protein